MKLKDIARVSYQFGIKDDWNLVEEFDNFVYIYDTLPPKMQIITDLLVEGKTRKQICKELKCNANTLNNQIATIKKRLLRGEGVI